MKYCRAVVLPVLMGAEGIDSLAILFGLWLSLISSYQDVQLCRRGSQNEDDDKYP
jgi:hypothetical protein